MIIFKINNRKGILFGKQQNRFKSKQPLDFQGSLNVPLYSLANDLFNKWSIKTCIYDFLEKCA